MQTALRFFLGFIGRLGRSRRDQFFENLALRPGQTLWPIAGSGRCGANAWITSFS
jgi:hypothetical protein